MDFPMVKNVHSHFHLKITSKVQDFNSKFKKPIQTTPKMEVFSKNYLNYTL